METINLKYLEAYCPCPITLDRLVNSFTKNFEFNTMADLVEALKKRENPPEAAEIQSMLECCCFLHSPEMLEYYFSRKPSFDEVRSFIREFPELKQSKIFKEYVKISGFSLGKDNFCLDTEEEQEYEN